MYDWRGNFGWSSSKSSNWRECKKRFYYSTIKKHDGDREALEIRQLSSYTSLPFLKGNAIHRAIGSQITHSLSGRSMDMGVALREVERLLAPFRQPSKGKTIEIVNGFSYDDQAYVKIMDDSRICLDHFFNDVWPMLATTKCIEHDPGDGGRGSIGEFNVAGIKVFVKPDLVSECSGIYTLTDWKTGKDRDDDYAQQMAIYSMYVMDKYKVDIEYVRAELVFLHELRIKNMQSLREDIERAKVMIKKETEEMLMASYPDGFPSTPGPHCRNCNYLTICIEGKENFGKWKKTAVEDSEDQ